MFRVIIIWSVIRSNPPAIVAIVIMFRCFIVSYIFAFGFKKSAQNYNVKMNAPYDFI